MSAEFERLVPHQSFVKNGLLWTFFDILDGKDLPVLNVNVSQMKLAFDEHELKPIQFAPFASTGEGVASVLLIDVTASLSPEQFMQAKYALKIWVDSMTQADRVCLIAFGNDVEVLSPFSVDRSELKSLIDGLVQQRDRTQLNDGIIEGLKRAVTIDPGLPDRRVIVALSDGIHQAPTGATQEEVLARIKEARVPFYSIAYENMPVNAYEKQMIEQGQRDLALYSRISGGGYYPKAQARLAETYAAINARIRNSYVIVGDVSNVQGDGKLHRVRLDYTVNNATLTEGMDVRYSPGDNPKKTMMQKIAALSLGVKAGIAGGLVVVVALLFVMSKKRSQNGPKGAAVPPVPPVADKHPDTSSAQASTGTQKAAAPPVSPAGVKISSKPAGVEITLTPLGTVGSKPYVLKVSDRVEIGRAATCAISIPDDSAVSSKHCEISWSEGILYLRDLESTNGTSVNGVPIKGLYRLKPGDTIGLGRVQLRLGELREA